MLTTDFGRPAAIIRTPHCACLLCAATLAILFTLSTLGLRLGQCCCCCCCCSVWSCQTGDGLSKPSSSRAPVANEWTRKQIRHLHRFIAEVSNRCEVRQKLIAARLAGRPLVNQIKSASIKCPIDLASSGRTANANGDGSGIGIEIEIGV